MRGVLAQPDVLWKNEYLKTKLRLIQPRQHVWFGLNKMPNGWCHIDGSLVGYTDWYPGRPILMSLVGYFKKRKVKLNPTFLISSISIFLENRKLR